MATASIDWVEYVLAGMLASYVGLLALGREPEVVAAGPPSAKSTGFAYLSSGR